MNDSKVRKQAPIPAEQCSIFKAADILGDRWTLLILREAFYGVVRFDDMRVDLSIPKAALSDRLKKLVEAEILAKVPYQEDGSRQRFYYRLTEKGVELAPVMVAMIDWSDKHLRQASPLVSLVHRQTGKPLKQAFVDPEGNTARVMQVALQVNLPVSDDKP